MKKAICLLLIFSVVILCGCEKTTEQAEVGGQIMGDFSAVDLDGKIIDESILSGHKLTMVNIWATYCSPCIEEMPALAELNGSWGENFQVVGIVMDASDKNPAIKTKALEIIEETNATYMHLLPSSSLKASILADVTAVPTTYFVDENGNQVGQVYIGAKTKTQWKKIISDLLEAM